MSDPHVLVIEHQSDAGLGQLEDILLAQGLQLTTVGPDRNVSVPSSLNGYDALIVLGGSMGPTDDIVAPWLPATRELLRESVACETPTLGICLGAQLLATATGGHVATMSAGPEVGLTQVEFNESAGADPLFAGFAGNTVSAVQWHWLEAAQLPESACVLASNTACQNQAFRIGVAAWGVQFHPEALSTTTRGWADDDPSSLKELGISDTELVDSVRVSEPELRRSWAVVAERFAEVTRAAHAAAQAASLVS